MSSSPSNRDRRVVVATATVVVALLIAGCTGSSEFATTISDPSTGDVFDNVSVDTIDQLDGARFDVDYSVNATDNATYSLVVYERQNGSLEWDGVYSLDPNGYHTGVSVSTPRPDEPPATYEIRVERGENATVLDAVTVTIDTSSA